MQPNEHPPKPGPDRLTVLLLGSDLRLPEDGASPHDDVRTDAMLVLSICPAQNTALLLSLPRDLYCQLAPELGKGRINTAYQLGNERGYPGGGGMLALTAVASLLEIKIDYYLLLDFAAFHLLINAIGPITVCPRYPIHDDRFPDKNYGVMEVHFDAGCQELDSVRLLQYARVRHTAGYDFGRAQRQQEIIRAVRNRVMTPAVLWKLARTARHLWRQVRPHIETNLPLGGLLYMAAYFASIPRAQIYSAVPTVQTGQLRNVTTAAQEQVLVPMPRALREMVQLVFDASPATVEVKPERDAVPSGYPQRIQRFVLQGATRALVQVFKGWFALEQRRQSSTGSRSTRPRVLTRHKD